MPQPFNVRSQDKPGTDLGGWDALGNITIPGTLTAANVVNQGASASGVASVTNVDGTVTVTGTATNPVVSAGAIPQASVTGLATALGLKAPLASPAFTGTATAVNETISGRLLLTPDTITYAASITPDCSLSNYFRVTLTGALTINAPTNAVDGQKITFELIQDGTGTRLVTLNAAFGFGTNITSFTATTTASKRDLIGVIYNSALSKFLVVAVAQGF